METHIACNAYPSGIRTAGPEGDITFTTEVVIFLVVLVACMLPIAYLCGKYSRPIFFRLRSGPY
jgi:hypothetical protein